MYKIGVLIAALCGSMSANAELKFQNAYGKYEVESNSISYWSECVRFGEGTVHMVAPLRELEDGVEITGGWERKDSNSCAYRRPMLEMTTYRISIGETVVIFYGSNGQIQHFDLMD